MSASEHIDNLLVMARKDFDALRGMVENPLFADEIFGFHAQQAIEKTFKAWLAKIDVEYPLTHDLSRLLLLLEESGQDVTDYWPLVEFNVFAVQARYESGLMELEEPLNRILIIASIDRLLLKVGSLSI
jgi:HEPN domain-containing protein